MRDNDTTITGQPKKPGSTIGNDDGLGMDLDGGRCPG